MALFFNADTEKVDYGSDGSLDTIAPLTIMYVGRITDMDGSIHQAVSKGLNTFIREATDTAGELSFFRGYTSSNANATSNSTPLSVNVWHIAFGVDGGAGVAPRIYHADIGADLVEIGYGIQNTPTGVYNGDGAQNLVVGHDPDTPSRSWVGDIARVAYIAQALTIGQCRTIYNRITQALAYDCRLYSELGFNGTGAQQDWSGNGNSGTVTGATVSDHVPMPPIFGFDVAQFISVAVVSRDHAIMAGVDRGINRGIL